MVVVAFDLVGERRARTDDAHLARGDVQQLGQLVERQATQDGADPGDAIRVGHHRVVAVHHGAELPDHERAAPHADPLLAEEHRAGRRQPDRCGAERTDHQRRYRDERQDAQVDESLASVRTLMFHDG